MVDVCPRRDTLQWISMSGKDIIIPRSVIGGSSKHPGAKVMYVCSGEEGGVHYIGKLYRSISNGEWICDSAYGKKILVKKTFKVCIYVHYMNSEK